MAESISPAGRAAAMSPTAVLDRGEAIPKLIGDPKNFLFVAGLAGTAKDTAALCGDDRNYYCLAGVMGAATMMGLGLALARPDKRVIVLTGDGELLMNIGSLAAISVMNPPNLSIVCVDNGHYGETGYQKSHTSLGVNLETMAAGAGIAATRTVSEEGQIAEAGELIRSGNSTSFILLKVKPTDPPKIRRSLDGALSRLQFLDALSGAA